MYLVIFKESSIKEIQSGSQYAFVDAFHLTRKIESRCKEQGVKVAVDFDLLDEHFTELYHGTFTFGSGYSTDIFDHIYKNEFNDVRCRTRRTKDRIVGSIKR